MSGLECSIRVSSTQFIGEEKDFTTEMYSGTYMDRLNKRYLHYKRAVDSGEVSALMNFDEAGMTFTQQGAVCSHLEFVKGQKTYNDYGTSVGKINLCIFTTSYELKQEEDYINIRIDYDILTGDDNPIKTNMEIKVLF